MIELATSALVLLSMFYGTPTVNATATNSSVPSVQSLHDPTIVDGVALIAPAGNANAVEMRVREYFKETPILAEIARCESQFRHTGNNGEIIKGIVNKSDIGVMQINEYYHFDEALKLGFDLKTLRGNMAFAKRLYEKQGTAPWQSSAECWEKSKAVAQK